METEQRHTMLPPAADEPCEERTSCLDWDSILQGGPVAQESLRTVASLTHLRLWSEEYDALAARVNEPKSEVPAVISIADVIDEVETVRPEPLKKAS